MEDRDNSDLGAFSEPLQPVQPAEPAEPAEPAQDDPAPDRPPEKPSFPPSAQKPLYFPEFLPGTEKDGEPAICSARKTTLYLYGMFLELVRKLYRDVTPYLKGVPPVRWLGPARKGGIWIDTEYNWNPEHPEFLPAIYVKLSQIGYQSELGPPNKSVGTIMKDAIYQYRRRGGGNVSFVHVSGTAGEAVALCDNTRAYLGDFCGPISDDLCLDEFWEKGVEPLGPAQKDSKDRYMSVTTFEYSFYEEWDIKAETPILKSIDLLQDDRRYGTLSLGGGHPPGEGPGADGGDSWAD